jgi:hypothetical protein
VSCEAPTRSLCGWCCSHAQLPLSAKLVCYCGSRADEDRTVKFQDVKREWENEHGLHRYQSGGALHVWKKIKVGSWGGAG